MRGGEFVLCYNIVTKLQREEESCHQGVLGYQERSRENDIDRVLVRIVTLQAMCTEREIGVKEELCSFVRRVSKGG